MKNKKLLIGVLGLAAAFGVWHYFKNKEPKTFANASGKKLRGIKM